MAEADDPAEESELLPANEELLTALNQLAAHIPSTPALRAELERLFGFCHFGWQSRDSFVVGESVTPKQSGLTALNTKAQRLWRELESTPQVLPWCEMIGVYLGTYAQERSREAASIVDRMDYEDIAKTFDPERENPLRIDLLIECLAEGIDAVCEFPVPISHKKARMTIRADAIQGIAKAFEQHAKPLSNNDLVIVARALAPFFPPEVGLAEITPRTVQRVMRQKIAS
jgi:hypothetical protein